jgi:hypothetical protein
MPGKNDRLIEAWTLDQIAKSAFFQRKLYEWKLLEIAEQLEQVKGENLQWDNLHISSKAWDMVIHRGIRPVIVFAQPDVLQQIPGSAGYYRMLAMVSQKSMKRIGLNVDAYEVGKSLPNPATAITIAQHLNRIISALIEVSEHLNPREFDLWRGMAAGSQAQGSWQNTKGSTAEVAIREIILARLQEAGLLANPEQAASRIPLPENRVLVYADDPDIAIYRDDVLQVALEVKGGIDQAGVLERVGAAMKSLRRARQENPATITILILQDISMTERAKADLGINTEIITHLFNTRAILESEEERIKLFALMGI